MWQIGQQSQLCKTDINKIIWNIAEFEGKRMAKCQASLQIEASNQIKHTHKTENSSSSKVSTRTKRAQESRSKKQTANELRNKDRTKIPTEEQRRIYFRIGIVELRAWSCNLNAPRDQRRLICCKTLIRSFSFCVVRFGVVVDFIFNPCFIIPICDFMLSSTFIVQYFPWSYF